MSYKSYFKLSALSLIVAATGVMADGGVSVQGTRIIYNQGVKQHDVLVKNSSPDDSFLVESWVETAAGSKTQDFILTPPLFLSSPKNENVLRLMYVGGGLSKDRESLYYFINKDIPSINEKDTEHKNVLRIAAASKIKLFVRPAGLSIDVNDAPSLLTFSQNGNKMDIYNPSPYYITVTDIKYGGVKLKDFMVAPQAHFFEDLPSVDSVYLSFSTINDYGAVTKSKQIKLK